MSLVHNEQTKLMANALDRASTACLTVGFRAPSAAAIYTAPNAFPLGPVVIIGTFAWISTAIVLHLMARRILRKRL